jgi:hypothetical protein
VAFVCLNVGNYCGRGAEYVNKLHDMVVRNLPSAPRFVCLTDDPSGLDSRIEVMPLPEDIHGWYGKLYMFKRGLFMDGERLIFMDLDTVVIGKLDDLLGYRGQFATLNDFYFPERVGPAVMLWEAGEYTASIWEEWCAEGRPENPLGDLWWINRLDQGRFAKRADKLQTIFPGMFVSFKRDCDPVPPKGAKVVCFHGLPRPHDAAEMDEWVGVTWEIGGMAPADLSSASVANTGFEQVGRNIEASSKAPYPWLPIIEKPQDMPAAIVGGGPSLVAKLEELRGMAKSGVQIFATNGAHDYLRRHGIEPDAHVIIDAKPECAQFISAPAKQYFLASQCDQRVFARAIGDVTLVHMNTRGVLKHIPESVQPLNLISSGSTVSLAAIAIAYCLGFRQFYLYGMDSSYEEARHAYKQDLNNFDRVIEAVAGGRTFKCAPWMVAQVEHFQQLAAELANAGCELHVRCGGLLGHVAWLWAKRAEDQSQQERATA